MPPFSAVLAANAANVPKAIVPVAVVVGGTAGIGAGVAEVLAQRTQGRAHIVIVGRNQAAAEAVIAQFPKAVDGGKYEFVQCDITSMRNVGTVARQLSQRLDKINYLVMTAGLMTMAGRQPTEDGLDVKLSIHYYGRFKFARDLAGLLEKAAEKGEPARVMTVLDSLRGGPIWPDDMALERNYSTANAARVGMMYNNAAIVVSLFRVIVISSPMLTLLLGTRAKTSYCFVYPHIPGHCEHEPRIEPRAATAGVGQHHLPLRWRFRTRLRRKYGLFVVRPGSGQGWCLLEGQRWRRCSLQQVPHPGDGGAGLGAFDGGLRW